MNIGSLYQVKKQSWLLFSTKETADVLGNYSANGFADNEEAAWYAARFSRVDNVNVTYFSHDTFVVFLEEDGMLKKFLTSEGLIGWTWVGEYERDNEYFFEEDFFEEVKTKP